MTSDYPLSGIGGLVMLVYVNFNILCISVRIINFRFYMNIRTFAIDRKCQVFVMKWRSD